MNASNCNSRDVSSIVMNPEMLLEVHAFVCRAELEGQRGCECFRAILETPVCKPSGCGTTFIVEKLRPLLTAAQNCTFVHKITKPCSKTRTFNSL